MKVFILALLLTSTSACQEKYPNLEDGLYAEFITTKGTMVATLFYDKVPVTVGNFVALAEGTHPNVIDSLKGKPFYNGLTFHRVMDKFMIQGGDQTATGSGNPGYRFESEFHTDLKHDKPGILSMANSGGTNTNGSQFFIMEVPYPSLDAYDANGNLKPCDQPRVSCHPVFGELVIGLEVQDSISNVEVIDPKSRNHKPVEDVVITAVNIIRKGSAAMAFDAAKTYTEELPKIAEKRKKLKEDAEAKLKEDALVASETFLKNNANLKGKVEKFPTGLVMIRTNESNGKQPSSADKVLIDCAGYFEDGRLFYTTYKDVAVANNQYNEDTEKRGYYKPFPMIYNATATLVPGFREAMLNMKVGDKARIFVPSYLGYGANGNAPLIPPNTNIIFDIEISGIQK